MNLPTNKLRDLIAALQTLDPDIETDVDAVNPVILSSGKRCLQLTNSTYEIRIAELQDNLDATNDELESLESNYADLRQRYDELSANLINIRETLIRTSLL